MTKIQIKNLVIKNDLKAAFDAIYAVAHSGIKNEYYLLLGRYERNLEQQRMGTINQSDFNLQTNQIVQSLLYLIDAIQEKESVRDELRGYVNKGEINILFSRISDLHKHNSNSYALRREFVAGTSRFDVNFNDRLFMMIDGLELSDSTNATNTITTVGNGNIIHQNVTNSNISINNQTPKPQMQIENINFGSGYANSDSLSKSKTALFLVTNTRTASDSDKEKAKDLRGKITAYEDEKLANNGYDRNGRKSNALAAEIKEFLSDYQEKTADNKAAKFQELIDKLGTAIPEIAALKEVYAKCLIFGYSNPTMETALTSKKIQLDSDQLADYADILVDFLKGKINAIG